MHQPNKSRSALERIEIGDTLHDRNSLVLIGTTENNIQLYPRKRKLECGKIENFDINLGCSTKVITSFLSISVLKSYKINILENFITVARQYNFPIPENLLLDATILDMLSYSSGIDETSIDFRGKSEFYSSLRDSNNYRDIGQFYNYGSVGHLLIVEFIEFIEKKGFFQILLEKLTSLIGIVPYFNGVPIKTLDNAKALDRREDTFLAPVEGGLSLSIKDYLKIISYFILLYEKDRENNVFFKPVYKIENNPRFLASGLGWLFTRKSLLTTVSSINQNHFCTVIDLKKSIGTVFWCDRYPSHSLIEDLYREREKTELFHKTQHDKVHMAACEGVYINSKLKIEIFQTEKYKFKFSIYSKFEMILTGKLIYRNGFFCPESDGGMQFVIHVAFLKANRGEVCFVRFDKHLFRKEQ